MWAIVEILAFSAVVVLASEALTYYFVYSQEQFRRLLIQIERQTKLRKIDKRNSVRDILVEELKDAPALKDKHTKRKQNAEESAKLLSAQLMPFNMKISGVNLVLILMAYQVLSVSYEGQVIATLPFQMFSLLSGLTHRGLAGDDYSQLSSHIFFALGLMATRSLAHRVMEARDLKPKMPKQPSVWELAQSFDAQQEAAK